MADEIDPLAHVFAELDQALAAGLVEQFQGFDRVRGAGETVADQGGGHAVEGHANFTRGIASLAQMAHFMATIAQTDPDGIGLTDYSGGPLGIEDLQVRRSVQRFFSRKDAPQAGPAAQKQVGREVRVEVDIAIKQLAEQVLIDIAAHPA